jgi:pilus assembly protein CpaC
MKLRTILFAAVVLTFLFTIFLLPGFALAEAASQSTTQPATQSATQALQEPVSPSTPQANLPPSSQAPGAAPLRVMVGKSLLINTTEPIKRISVTDPSVAYAIPITPTQILVHGRASGEVSLLIWDELERSRSFDLRVDVDVSAAAEEEHRVFPEEQISVSPSRAAIVLSGHVTLRRFCWK